MTGTYAQIQRRGIEADALQVALEVAALPASVVREMAPLLMLAEQETARALRAWLASGNGDTRYTAYQHARALVQLRAAFDTIKRTSPALTTALGRGASRAGVLSAQHLTGIIHRNSARFGSPLEAPIRLDLARIAATGQGLIPRFASSAARYSETVRAEIRQQLAVGILRGETYSGLMQRLAGRAGVAGAGVEPTPANAAHGLFRGATWQLERLARTEMAHASEVQALEGFHQARVQLPDLKRKWVAALDRRSCPRCGALDETLSDAAGDFAAGNPPLHPNCRCCAVPWREAWGEMLAEAA